MKRNPKCLKSKTPKIIIPNTTRFQGYKNAKRGIALLVALGAMIVILIIASLTIYLITSGLRVAGGQKQYQSAFEASEGGIEIGIGKVDSVFRYHVSPTSDILDIGRFKVNIRPRYLFTAMGIGAGIKFARASYGIGGALAKGGSNLYYLVGSQSVGIGGEKVAIEIEYRKTLGVD